MTMPRWWKRDLNTGKIIVEGYFNSTFYPITTACFVRDWTLEGTWKTRRPNIVIYDPADPGVGRFLLKKKLVIDKQNP